MGKIKLIFIQNIHQTQTKENYKGQNYSFNKQLASSLR